MRSEADFADILRTVRANVADNIKAAFYGTCRMETYRTADGADGFAVAFLPLAIKDRVQEFIDTLDDGERGTVERNIPLAPNPLNN